MSLVGVRGRCGRRHVGSCRSGFLSGRCAVLHAQGARGADQRRGRARRRENIDVDRRRFASGASREVATGETGETAGKREEKPRQAGDATCSHLPRSATAVCGVCMVPASTWPLKQRQGTRHHTHHQNKKDMSRHFSKKEREATQKMKSVPFIWQTRAVLRDIIDLFIYVFVYLCFMFYLFNYLNI